MKGDPTETKTRNRRPPLVAMAELCDFEHISELTVRSGEPLVKVGKNLNGIRRKTPTGSGVKARKPRCRPRFSAQRRREIGSGEDPPAIRQLGFGLDPTGA